MTMRQAQVRLKETEITERISWRAIETVENDNTRKERQKVETEDTTMTYAQPNQPAPEVVQKQVFGERILTFQKTWYDKYPQLHVNH